MSFKAIIGVTLALVFAGSSAARLATQDDGQELSSKTESTAPQNPGSRMGATSLVGGNDQAVPTGDQPGAPQKERSAFIDSLPMISEASFFGFLGFALGYASRKVVKIGMIVVALLFVALQGLQYLGVVDNVNWGKGLEAINGLILNLKQDQSWLDILKNRIPAAGALAAGYFLGFRKG